MQLTAQMRRHATTVGRQVTWRVIAQMNPSATCAMYLGMWPGSAPEPMYWASGEVVGVVEFVAVEAEVTTVTLYVGTVSNWGI